MNRQIRTNSTFRPKIPYFLTILLLFGRAIAADSFLILSAERAIMAEDQSVAFAGRSIRGTLGLRE